MLSYGKQFGERDLLNRHIMNNCVVFSDAFNRLKLIMIICQLPCCDKLPVKQICRYQTNVYNVIYSNTVIQYVQPTSLILSIRTGLTFGSTDGPAPPHAQTPWVIGDRTLHLLHEYYIITVCAPQTPVGLPVSAGR